VEPAFGLEHSFLRVDGDGVMVSACKRAEAPDPFEAGDPQGRLALRLYNPTPAPRQARISLSVPIQGAWRSTILEEEGEPLEVRDGRLSVLVPPKKIVTLLIAASER
jgi:alpha-mannosidase